jgi:tripartite-type tricarboxylate transporter receptor subunit TctC
MNRFLVILLAGALLAPASAQSNPDYPNKPVRIIVNVAPGGGVDTATRIIADQLRARLGQPFVVENRPGAGGNIGAEVVFQSEGDGYTLLASSPTPLAINGRLYKKLNFDPAGFEPVAMMSRIPNVLVVRPDFPAKSVQELIAVANANPGKLSFGSQGIGTASHLTGELFMTLTGTKLVHIPYKGNTSNVLTDVVAGHVDLSFIQFSAVHELQQSGKLRVLAVATDKRLEALPDVPTWRKRAIPISSRKPGTRSARRRRRRSRSFASSTPRSTRRCRNRRCWRACGSCRYWWAAVTKPRRDGSSRSNGRSGAK